VQAGVADAAGPVAVAVRAAQHAMSAAVGDIAQLRDIDVDQVAECAVP
jgi:hypothetical protein